MKILGNTLQKILTSMEWGRHHESVAFELYKQKKLRENSEIVITKPGLWISPEHPSLVHLLMQPFTIHRVGEVTF